MSRYFKIALIMLAPAFLFASGDNEFAQKYMELTGRATDFAPRIFNFLLLVGLLYYLLANPLKKFLKDRTNSIANELQEIENARVAAKEAKIKAEEELKAAKEKAEEIIEDAKKEALLLKEKIAQKAKEEVEILEKTFKEKCEIEERKVIRETTLGILDENISTKDIPLDSSKIIDIVTKEVA